jgi:hypothetical protein
MAGMTPGARDHERDDGTPRDEGRLDGEPPGEEAAASTSVGSIRSIGSAGSILSIGSAGSILSIGSAGSILSIGSAGSILSIGSRASILSIGSLRSVLSIGSRESLRSIGRFRAVDGARQPRPVTRTVRLPRRGPQVPRPRVGRAARALRS